MNKHIFNRASLGCRFVICFGLISIVGIVQSYNDIVYKLIFLAMSFILVIIMWTGCKIWRAWEIFGRCNLESERLLAETLRGKGIRIIKIKVSLLSLYIPLGYEEKSKKIINELNDVYSEMPEDLKLKFRIIKLCFHIDVDGYEESREQIKDLIPEITDLDKSNNDYITVMFAYYYSDKDWNKALEVLENTKIKNVYDQVRISYLQGLCYFQLKEYQQSFYYFEISKRFGGNTKYVSLAQNMIDQLPVETKREKNTYKRVSYYFLQVYKMIACVIGFCCVIGVFVSLNESFSYGNNVQEIYAKRHLTSESEVDILYQGKVADYEIIIVNCKKYLNYTFFQKVDGNGKDSYKMIYQARMNKEQRKAPFYKPYLSDLLSRIYGKDFFENKDETYNQMYIANILSGLYRKKIFDKKDMTYIGAAFDKSTSNITIEGKPLKIKKEIQNGEETIYIWEISDINAKDAIFNMTCQED